MNLFIALIISTLLALFALWRRALTPIGSLLAWALCLLITFAGGRTAFGVLAATFLCTVAADKLAGSRADPHGLRRKSGRRDAVRVLCNVGVGALAMALYLMSYRSAFAVAYAGVMAESLADSMASKIGPLVNAAVLRSAAAQRKLSCAPAAHPHGRVSSPNQSCCFELVVRITQPRDLCTGRPVPTGLSGGVTLLGTCAEGLGAAVIAAIWGVGTKSLAAAVIVFAAGFLGAMADSVFGSRLQAKFRCPTCGALTEREEHCNVPGTLVSGFRRITNDTVNLLSNASALTFVLAIRAIGAFAF